MGPINDKLGVEQGGCNSDRLYKLANNAELNLTQQSQLGVQLGAAQVERQDAQGELRQQAASSLSHPSATE